MEHKIFAIYDQKAFAYLPPFTLPRVEMAERTFLDCINSDSHAFGKHPADYTLVELGTYDDLKGLITTHDAPKLVGSGIEYLTPKEDLSNGNVHALGNGPSIQPGSNSGDPAIKL